MDALNTFILLMFIAVLLVGFAQKIGISYPIILVCAGGILGFIPSMTPFDFNPQLLLVIVLPPILFYASYTISFKEFTHYLEDIFSLAIGLVIITTCLVGFLFKWLFPDLSWPLAFAFGALISPPDAVATTMILKRFAITSRLKVILEGESLINDASSLVIYKFSIITLLTGSFSPQEAVFHGFYAVCGGIILGLFLGYSFNRISSFLTPILAVAFSFVIPYMTFYLANFSGTSGVLAVVACGLLGARLLTRFAPLTRVLGWASWDIITILLNCFIFILIGLNFRHILERMPVKQIILYSGYGILLTCAIILIRFVFIYVRRGLWHLYVRKDFLKAQQSRIYLRHALISSWAGMRGIVSLTAALALPFNLPDGTPLAGRDIVIFLTFEIIFLTLIIPGLTLPLLIKWLGIQPSLSYKEMSQIRKHLAQIATIEIHQLHQSNLLNDAEKELLIMYFYSRDQIADISTHSEEHIVEKTRHQILQKQRKHLMKMWLNNEVSDALMSHLERELDIEESHLAKREFS